MDEPGLHSFLRVKRRNVRIVQENAEKIWDLFGARLYEEPVDEQNVSNSQSGVLLLRVDRDYLQGDQSQSLTDFTAQLQQYVDAVCGWERDGDDSSYDSDFEEASSSHADVSRTVSDTLAAEYAEYVSSDALSERLSADLASTTSAADATNGAAGYAARVDFGLKLGYAESLVQAALRKLGPAPAQNELLEELVKLGAARSPRSPDGAAAAATFPVTQDDAERPGVALLRPIVIDGSNVAMSHGNKEVFSCRGIKICVDWFRSRGHRDITVFVPKWRKEASRLDNPISEQEVLTELERERALVFTPSRLVGGKRMVCYDDRYILRLAADVDGVVVSNDNYRDLAQEKPEFRKVVEERILMYSFVNDRFMPPEDPLGRSGPTLEVFLRRAGKLPACPYAKKCTYGNKCKFHHPERATPHKSVTERLLENAQRHMQARGGHPAHKSVSLPLPSEGDAPRKQPLSRTRSTTPMAAAEDSTPHHRVDPMGCFRTPPPGYGPGWCRPPSEAGPPPEGNLHRKLARQLTLNPSCDPRLLRLHHRPVARHASDSTPWERGHASVARISSAPPLVWPPPPAPCSLGDARRRMHYHLAAIFPEEQVTKAMQLYPDETNPQKICAAILAMFPKT